MIRQRLSITLSKNTWTAQQASRNTQILFKKTAIEVHALEDMKATLKE